MKKLTKAEETVLAHIRYCNAIGALAGLSTSPSDPNFTDQKFRFVRRLFIGGMIKWVSYHNALGAGWALSTWSPPAV